MEFRTLHHFDATKQPIDFTSSLLSIGSCFATHMGAKLEKRKFSILTNPGGIIYNPMSIAQIIDDGLHLNTQLQENSFFEYLGFWHSWNHHGSFSRVSKLELIESIYQSNQSTHMALRNASHLLITWGSAYVYEKNSDGKMVANCHKVPGKEFSKRLLEPSEITQRYIELIKSIRAFNPEINLIWSISPVKHIRDGLHENNLSKSVLFLAMQDLLKLDTQSYYFPAFELVQDELRDYRFYREDMAHPSEQAINYVWESFVTHCFSSDAKQAMQQIEELQQAMAHQPLRPNSDAHISFRSSFLKKVLALKSKYPQINLKQEESYFSPNN
jgi:hypothetical protein